jgi:hypothetical protein
MTVQRRVPLPFLLGYSGLPDMDTLNCGKRE